MFGHNSFVWTPVKVFNAGTEAPAGHTGPFVIIKPHSLSPSGDIHYWQTFNEDMSRYTKPGSVAQNFSSAQGAIDSLDEAMYYKMWEEPPPITDSDCVALNRKVQDWQGDFAGKSCGNCIDGFQEPIGSQNCSGSPLESCGEACIAVASSDPNDCATANRAKNTDDTCGNCLSGYSEDTTTGNCIEDGPNYALWGGIAAVGAVVMFVI